MLAVAPVEKTFLPVDQGLRCVFATGTAGKYTFVLVVAGTNVNGRAVAEMATHSVLVSGGTAPPHPTPGPAPAPTPMPDLNPYLTPKPAWQTLAAGVLLVKTNRVDATNLAELYDSAKRLVLSAPAALAAGTKPEVGTTAELREWLIRNGQQLGLQGKYPGLAAAVDVFLGKQLGTAIRKVTENDADMLGVLAWAIWEGGK
ncbi:MAG: hypothetical protein DDT35_01443 [Firmicutes bacterium]|nr:hypothetical protein [Bacillota bacterium]